MLSTLVFWAAHVFAHAVAAHGVHDGKPVPRRRGDAACVPQICRDAVRPDPARDPLFLGAFGVIPDSVAVEAALWASVAVLAILGFLAFTARRSNWFIRILGGLGTALLGIVIIGLNAALH